ncbi:YdaS family helix-turn-helix protein [Orbaceae bacterium ESL0727]|nr:YdaS family helix-turn-helix protein [Orbaceae bacterium ESL0727]
MTFSLQKNKLSLALTKQEALMKLSIYLAQLPYGGKSQFAKDIGISKAFLRHIEIGLSPIPPKVAKRIEEHTQGQVTKAELRPDLWAE